MEILQKFIDTLTDLDQESADKLIDLVTIKNFNKNDFLAKKNKKQVDFFILKSGIVRSYYSDEDGKVHIRNFFTTLKTSGDIGALITNKPSKLYYDCLTDCEVYAINFKDFINLVNSNHNFSKLYNTMLTNIVLVLQSKVYDLSVLNGTERYLKLRKEIPELENLIPQYHIASYLNITPVQLSRIRRDLSKNTN
ncbi:Crp/Fnr family transcriptional regulator [uncultured Polaribacter sp.]|uniref:Crp/Fnr family transcriptional regulator n=1 Tax=uncultured Polaribacter sp. TaxID=174711 RepID=UPI00262E8892|nr:Crp/Fnr family transcriptional regulator [uncultured Polaribacter sp.]